MKALFVSTLEYSSNTIYNQISRDEQENLKQNGFKGTLESEFNGVSTYKFAKIVEVNDKREAFNMYNFRTLSVSFDCDKCFQSNIKFIESIGINL